MGPVSGVTTVESLDAITGVVGFRIDARYHDDQHTSAILHIILGNGGVIESETLQAEFHDSSSDSTKPRVPYYVEDLRLERT
jgi:hypothetical protein